MSRATPWDPGADTEPGTVVRGGLPGCLASLAHLTHTDTQRGYFLPALTAETPEEAKKGEMPPWRSGWPSSGATKAVLRVEGLRHAHTLQLSHAMLISLLLTGLVSGLMDSHSSSEEVLRFNEVESAQRGAWHTMGGWAEAPVPAQKDHFLFHRKITVAKNEKQLPAPLAARTPQGFFLGERGIWQEHLLAQIQLNWRYLQEKLLLQTKVPRPTNSPNAESLILNRWGRKLAEIGNALELVCALGPEVSRDTLLPMCYHHGYSAI